MSNSGSLAKTAEYGKKLIHAGIRGIEAGERSAVGGRLLPPFLFASARESLPLVALGACAGVLGCQLMHRRAHPVKIFACGALAFAAGFSWKTRKVGVSLSQAALREVSKVRDEHWLELHPIDYA